MQLEISPGHITDRHCGAYSESSTLNFLHIIITTPPTEIWEHEFSLLMMVSRRPTNTVSGFSRNQKFHLKCTVMCPKTVMCSFTRSFLNMGDHQRTKEASPCSYRMYKFRTSLPRMFHFGMGALQASKKYIPSLDYLYLTLILWPPDANSRFIGKDPDTEKD